jgi:hypothetical protein
MGDTLPDTPGTVTLSLDVAATRTADGPMMAKVRILNAEGEAASFTLRFPARDSLLLRVSVKVPGLASGRQSLVAVVNARGTQARHKASVDPWDGVVPLRIRLAAGEDPVVRLGGR